jgi:CHAT domain-containing protein
LGTPSEAFAWWEWYKGASLRAQARDQARGDFKSFVRAVASTGQTSQGIALLSYALLRNSIVAFVFYKGAVHVHEQQLPPNLELLARLFLTHCRDPSTDARVLNGEELELYNILISPLEPYISGANALRIETDGVLDQIQFTLLAGPNQIYLGDQFEVTFSQGMLYGLRCKLASKPVSPNSAALIVAVAEARTESLARLPEADEEATDVASYFNRPTVLSGVEATRSDLLKNLHNAQIFHFAGHAVVSGNRVGLVLGSGELLSARDLATARSPYLNLAVLSACDTANGGAGTVADVNSITRTLLAAGVSQIVASRWKVDSGVTRQLMQSFYRNLTAGKTAAESLREASLSIRGNPKYRHPYYWSPFSLFSNS